MLIKYIVYITFGFKTIHVRRMSLLFVLRTFNIYDAMQSESMVNRTRINLRSRYFLGGTITRCQVPSRVRAWFHDSAGDIDFYQMSLSQSESTILHESIIFLFHMINSSWLF